MTFSSLSIATANLEIVVFCLTVAVLITDLFLPRYRRQYLHWGIVAALLMAAMLAFSNMSRAAVVSLNGFFLASPLTALLKGMVLLVVAACLALSYRTLRQIRLAHGDFYALVLFSMLGMLIMISAAHLLSLYMGLEIMSLCLYAVIGMRRENVHASEAAIKYFVLGALASGVFLYGVSMVYGATGELGISEIAASIATGDLPSLTLTLGLVFMLSGMAFKLGAAPFHMWLPDVYHASPTVVTLFVATAPKVAAVAMILRVLTEALPALSHDWRQMLVVLSVLSLVVGNVTAIAQVSLKRMLAYSAIAHSGFLLLAVIAGGDDGIVAACFYVVTYAFMALGGFGLVMLLAARRQENVQLADMRGLASRDAVLAVVLAILMLSMAGIPPMVGFVAKLGVLQALVGSGYISLAVIAVLLSAVGAFYYLRVIWLMFFEESAAGSGTIRLRTVERVITIAVAFATLSLGIFPGMLLSLFESAVSASLT